MIVVVVVVVAHGLLVRSVLHMMIDRWRPNTMMAHVQGLLEIVVPDH